MGLIIFPVSLAAKIRIIDAVTKHQKAYIQHKLKTGGYNSASEVVREALRYMAAADADRERLEALLGEADQEPVVPIGKSFWTNLKSELHRDFAKRRKAKAA